jgi:hypothetical protein
MSYLPLKDGVISSNTLWSSTKITNYIDGEFSDKGLGGVTGLSDSNDNTLVTTDISKVSGTSGILHVPYFDANSGEFSLQTDGGFEILQSGSSIGSFTDETLLSATRIQALVSTATSNITTTLSGLDDTRISSLSSGQFIRYQDGKWENTTLSTTDLNGLITAISPIEITGDTTIVLNEGTLVSNIDGNGLTANTSNETINVNTGSGITINNDKVELKDSDPRNYDHEDIVISTGHGLKGGGPISSTMTISIDENGVENDNIASGAVQTTQIADGAVDTAKIAQDAVGSNEISGDAVTPTQLDTSQSYNFSAKVTTDLSAPFDTDEFVPKSYVDGIKQGLDFKDSVDFAPTDNINLGSNSLSTIDGKNVQTFGTGRILLTQQSSGEENGIYRGDLSDPTSWVRADDANEDGEVTPGMYVFVEAGDQNGSRSFVLTNTTKPTLGTDALNFAPFGQAGKFTGGANIEINGQEISVVNTTSSGSGQILDFSSSNNGSDSDSLIAYDTDNNLSWTPGLSITDATNSEINVGFTGDTYLTASASGVTDGNQLDLEVNLDYGELLNGLAGDGLVEDGNQLNVGEGSGITVSSNDVSLDDTDPRNIDHGDIDISAESGLTVSGDLLTGFTYSIATDGVQLREIDQSIAPTWTGEHNFEVGLYTETFRAGVREVSSQNVSVSPNEDYVILVDTSVGDTTVTLPATDNLTGGEFFTIKKVSPDNFMAIEPANAGTTIDGQGEYVTSGEGLPSIKLVYSSSNDAFFII